MAEWRHAFALQSGLEAWAVASAAQRSTDDAAEIRRVLLEELAQSTSLREDLHLNTHVAIQQLLATSATNHLLAADLETTAASYLAAGPIFVAGPSLAKPAFRPSATRLD